MKATRIETGYDFETMAAMMLLGTRTATETEPGKWTVQAGTKTATGVSEEQARAMLLGTN